jgi:hypothetical protein
MDAVTGIPAEQVGRVVQDYIDDGATKLRVEENADGTFTVTRDL